MFDVDWTDPDAERVGERRARKGVEREVKKKDDGRSVRESVSSRSSLSSADKAIGFLGSLGLKIGTTSLRSKRASPRPSVLRPSSSSGSQKRASVLSQSAATDSAIYSNDSCITSDDKESQSMLPIQGGHPVCSTPPDRITDRSSKGSVLSKSTEVTTPSSPCRSGAAVASSIHMAQEASYTSDVVTQLMQSTVKALESNKTETGEENISQPKTPQQLALSPVLAIPGSDMPTSLLIHEWFTSVHGEGSPQSPSAQRSPRIKHPLSTLELKPPNATASSPTRPAVQEKLSIFPTPPAKLKAHNPKAWRTPDNWGCSSPVDPETPSATSLQSSLTREQDAAQFPMLTLDISAVQREIARMAAASPEIIVVRLNEDWGSSNDASFYKELEMEKKRWMLSALRGMNRPAIDTSRQGGEGQNILALFESLATTSYLAALHPKAVLTHLAPKPISKALFPNVQPVSSPIRMVLPLEPNTYTAAHCLCLPSLMAGRDIPRVLRSIHCCLAPKGVLHLTLIDPSPASQSVGPRMRHWLDQNLLLNLESRFRCISPSRLFPAWLADARLRANGSVITRVKFKAIHQHKQDGDDTAHDEADPAQAELRSTVGRKLWQDVWGRFVHGTAWWWNDPACVEECLRLGTYFEYSMVEAVKDTV